VAGSVAVAQHVQAWAGEVGVCSVSGARGRRQAQHSACEGMRGRQRVAERAWQVQ